MNNRGKSINLYLMDGKASGRIKCTLANWTGIAYKIPRTDLEKCKDRGDLKQSGIYFLFGISDETDENIVYVGQAGARKNGEGLLNRLQEHKRDFKKDYWTEAIVFTTSNNSFGPTEISFLENKFCNLAKQSGRYIVKNENDPTLGNITEEKESELEEFADNAQVIMGTLGHKLFELKIRKSEKGVEGSEDTEDELLYLKRNIKKFGIVEAFGQQTTEGFVVMKGSSISPEVDNSIPVKIVNMRKKFLINENNILQEDVLLTSPTYAAVFVIGKSANGLVEWKNKNGITLKKLEVLK